MPVIQRKGAQSSQGFGEFAQSSTAANYIEDVFSTYLYKGNGSTQTINNGIDLAGKGGLVWIKQRNQALDNVLTDTARGNNNYLVSNTTAAQVNLTNQITSFNSNGFSLGNIIQTNESGYPLVSWTFRKQAKFFDVVTYTGNGANRTISHNLGSVPGCIMIKRTDQAAAWAVYHRSLANTEYLVLNTTATKATGATYWNSTTPTSTVFSLGTSTNVNASGGTYVAYLFAHDAGGFGSAGTDNVISCGSFTDNGSGTSVNLGYEPQFLIVKGINVSTWVMRDVMRNFSYSGNALLYPNLIDAESAGTNAVVPTATGFQLNSYIEGAGVNIVYIAIRRGPMKTPTSGTSVYEPVSFTGNNTANTTRGTTVTTDLAIISATNAGTPQGPYNQAFFDRLRGEDVSLTSSGTAAEVSAWANTFFNLDQQVGWSNGSDTTYLNNSAITYVTYNLRRAPGFFDVVCYTGTGVSGQTYSHNLTTVPEMMIIKSRSNVQDWNVYHKDIGNTKFLVLNQPFAQSTSSGAWNNTTPTSTLFTLGNNFTVNGGTSYTYVAYLFASCPGVSKVGSYTGTGALQTINCGFTSGARFVLIKRTDSTGDWYVWDSARGITSGNDSYILFNSAAAQVTTTNYVDTDTTGFKVTAAAPAALNANGGTYIFLAIA